MSKRKKQRVLTKQKWNKQIKFYHNKSSEHFYLGVAKRGDYIAGHDMTTHPSLTTNGRIRKKYIQLAKNPNPIDRRISYIDKKLRENVKLHYEDSGNKRLTVKRKWKLDRESKKKMKKLDRNKLK